MEDRVRSKKLVGKILVSEETGKKFGDFSTPRVRP